MPGRCRRPTSALEDLGLSFIVASRTSKAPKELADNLGRCGSVIDDGETAGLTRPMGQGRDRRTLHTRIDRAQWVADKGGATQEAAIRRAHRPDRRTRASREPGCSRSRPRRPRASVVLAARDAVTRDEPRVPVRIRDQRTVEARLVRRRHVDSHRKHACVPDRLGVQLVHEVSESKRYIGIAHAAGAV